MPVLKNARHERFTEMRANGKVISRRTVLLAVS
ncbi:hypothetical protein REJC140_00129 [Pseudorhizobium endolithicum]|uniref:Transposase n=1 Tax=Pseudorhizobium endolithicum TaxID=1191678 RepID=A0ABM8PCM8_9HYPH|nr:hypothetical protein REJC140_00129 [Pseudorhizobium endolithicum]